jgi:signal transduction histidine kinase/predicted CoA-binding protein
LEIGHAQLNELLDTSPSATRAMLHTVTSRLRTSELLLRESEKLAQLGTLTAGIAHELNNPAAAVQRGADQLLQIMDQLIEVDHQLDERSFSREQQQYLLELRLKAGESARTPSDIDPLVRSDRELVLENWLDNNNVENGWELAPILVNLGLDEEALNHLEADFRPENINQVLKWLGITYTVHSLLAEIGEGATRIAEIVKSLKTYVYLDQAPIQSVDVHEGIDNTLVMLRHKLKQGIVVRRDYDSELPKIQAFGSELNQVWTNLIDNAIDAMQGQGEIIIRSRRQGEFVLVEIEDNGPGIPEEIQSKIFSPFFTTKSVGKGTGLGLSISYNIVQKHGGEIKVYSIPGRTRFQVCLPINFEKDQSLSTSVEAIHVVSDDQLINILKSSKIIGVVGISDKYDQPNHTVPAYMQTQGYRIIPINPNLREVLGQKAYPDLLSAPKPIDIVLIFRRSEAVPGIVNQAIQIGAKVVWMQEGIVNEGAANVAHEAGLEVVMDTCIRATHRRLMG